MKKKQLEPSRVHFVEPSLNDDSHLLVLPSIAHLSLLSVDTSVFHAWHSLVMSSKASHHSTKVFTTGLHWTFSVSGNMGATSVIVDLLVN